MRKTPSPVRVVHGFSTAAAFSSFLTALRTALFLGVLAAMACQTDPEIPASPEGQGEPPAAKEASSQWRSLFNGQNFDGWSGFAGAPVPSGWVIEEGTLHFSAEDGKGRGDIMTVEAFRNFELSLEWKISPGGNSGIFYHVALDANGAWVSGPEMQVLDNAGHGDGQRAETSAGSNYALHAPRVDATRPVGEFNQARILVQNGHVEHWLNGEKLLEYQLGSPEWEELVRNSKFKDHPGYGRAGQGYIVLQDHGDKVWYRNIQIRTM